MIVGNPYRKSQELNKNRRIYRIVILRKHRRNIGRTKCTLERASISRGHACKWKTFAFRDDDKYCIERRHAIFIVAAERYGHREGIYPWHLELPIQRRRGSSIKASGNSQSFISYAFFESCSKSRIRINRISGLTSREVPRFRMDHRERLESSWEATKRRIRYITVDAYRFTAAI